MEAKKNLGKKLEEDENSIGIFISISFANGNTSISMKRRANKGQPLSVISIDNATDSQLEAVCNVLDNL